MNLRAQPQVRFRHRHLLKPVTTTALTTLLALTLSACGGDSSSDSSADDHQHGHEHNGRLLFSLSNTTSLRVFDQAEAEFESLQGDASGNAATLVLADNGLSAVVLANKIAQVVYSGLHAEEDETDATHTATNTTNTTASEEHAHDEHEHAELLTLSLSNVERVISTQGHFSLLANGATQLLPSADVETAGLDFESITGPAAQSFPALVLDEAHELFLFFADDKAQVYEAGVVTADEFACSNPQDAAQAGALNVVLCDEGLQYLLVEDDSGVHSLHSGTVSFASATSITALTSNGHDVVAYNGSNAFLLHEGAAHSLNAETLPLTLGAGSALCQAAFASEDSETLALVSDDAFLNLLNLADSSLNKRVALDETVSSGLSCAQLALAFAPEGFLVADKQAALLYLIDAHDGPYHVHSRYRDSQLSNLSQMVFMHSMNAAHEHEHQH